MRRAVAALLALGLLGPVPAGAQSADACGSFKWSISREQKVFASNVASVASGANVPEPGLGMEVALAAQDSVAFMVVPTRRPKSNPAYGAELTTKVETAGTYEVTLSADAWVDLAQVGKTLKSSDFSGKQGCPGIRKSVRFTLAAGPLTIAISDSPVDHLKLVLLPAE